MDGLAILAQNRLPFAELLGIRFISASADRIEAVMEVREDLCTTPAVLHGGAIMSLADTLGACATVLNLEDGAGTTTLESKTNFLARRRSTLRSRPNALQFIAASARWSGKHA